MRIYNLLLFVLLPVYTLCQEKATVRLTIGDCRLNENHRMEMYYEIQIFKGKELFREIKAANYNKTPILISGFSKGNYSVVFTNFYRERISKEFAITNTDTSQWNLCTDSLNQYSHNVFTEMVVGDSLVIHCSTVACFYDDFGGIKISVTKTSDGYSALVSGNRNGFFVLSEKQKLGVLRFYNELLAIKDSDNCTTINTYNVTFKNKKTIRVDGGCKWSVSII